MNTLSLNGNWKLSYNYLKDKSQKWDRWINAIVPGDVHLDLMRENLILDPLVSDNNKTVTWMEELEWWYKKKFYVENLTGQPAELVCEGLDLTADIWINNKKVGSTNNMFVTHRFDITDVIKEGCNEIIIRIDAGFEAVEGKDTDKFKLSWNRYEPRRPWMRKAQQCFYWDVAPRLVTCGIWRGVHIDFLDEVVLRDVYVTSKHGDNTAHMKVEYELEAFNCSENSVLVQVSGKDFIAQKEAKVKAFEGTYTGNIEIEIKNPLLWWPNGMGEQNLYEVRVMLFDSQGKQLCERVINHGIREIKVVKEPLNNAEKTFTFMVNGEKVFCRGGDWVPSDAIYGRINEENEYKLLKYAKECNFNMMRIWGGGVYPDTYFYDICDKMGIMVWQDFMYACGYYPDDEEEFCNGAEIETEKVIRKFRNHASLACWCGNNETYQMHQKINPDGFFGGLKIYSEIIPDAINRLDPQTYYQPSDPYPGPWPDQEKEGTQHVWSFTLGYYDLKVGKEGYTKKEIEQILDYWNYAKENYKFVTEFGLYCPSNLSTVQKFMGEHPANSDMESPVYRHHRNYFEAAGVINETLRRFYCYKEHYSTLEYTMAGQAMQGEILKYILETFRNRAYICSGALFWEYNDTWGHVGYAPVDYYLSIKPVYYYMKSAFRPLHITIAEAGKKITILNETRIIKNLFVVYGIRTFSGESIFESQCEITSKSGEITTVADISLQLSELRLRKDYFIFAELYENGKLNDRTRQFVSPIPEMAMPGESLTYEVEKISEKHWIAQLNTVCFSWMVKLDSQEEYSYSDNAFDMWPGESRTVDIYTKDEEYQLDLQIYTMNQFRS